MNHFPYRKVFDAVEKHLIELGTENLSAAKIRAHLNQFKEYETRRLSDNQYFHLLVMVAFYSGFRAATVTAHEEVIKKHFPNWRTVSAYKEKDIRRIMKDSEMIRHEGKIRGCVKNAQRFSELVSEHGSFKSYVESFSPKASDENLRLLSESLKGNFAYFGPITVLHFMGDIGLPVLKPDLVISRTFQRLGLLKDPRQLVEAVLQGRKFAHATGHPIRYIDIVFVSYGQVRNEKIGMTRGICLDKPRCGECSIVEHCAYAKKRVPVVRRGL